MEEVIIATPIHYSASTMPHDFGNGITIQELKPILWDRAVHRASFSPKELDALAETRYWLCVTDQTDNIMSITDNTWDVARRGMSALQIVCPCGAKNIFLRFHKLAEGYDQIQYCRPNEMNSAEIGPIVLKKHTDLANLFPPIFAGVTRAFSEEVVRLQNPIIMLEKAMQADNHYLGVLLCVMGLDVLFMAGEKSNFIRRIGGFLGTDSFVFPPVLSANCQPTVKIGDVLADMYEVRNLTAHGLPIPKYPFREKYELRSTDGHPLTYNDYYYTELILDSSLFILAGALRKLFTESLADDACDQFRWKAKMTVFEHRFKNSGGMAAFQRR
jgi:hypothetical protein